MLKRLKLSNLQGHKDSDIVFSPRVNVLLGKSNAGKTTAFRALDWITNNSTSGAKLLSSFAKRGDVCSVKLLLTDGQVERFYSKSTNGYKLNGTELKAIGKGVPDEVAEVLNFGELNVKSQHEGFFMLNDSGGKIAKQLNELVDLEIIDTTIANLNSKSRAINSKIKFKKEELEEKEKDLANYKEVDSAISSFKTIEKTISEKEGLQKEITELSSFISDLDKLDLSRFDGLDEASDMLADISVLRVDIGLKETQYESLLRLMNDARNLSNQNKALSKAIEGESLIDDILAINDEKIALEAVSNEIRGAIESIYSIKEELASFEHLDGALELIGEIEEIDSSIEDLEYSHLALKDYLIDFTNHKNIIKVLDGRIEEMEVELKEEMGDSCPLCGGAVENG